MIELGYALPGAALLTDDKGVNETYRGIIEVNSARLSAYIKLLPDRQLVNELLASVLGRLVNLPIPRGFLVTVERADYPNSALLTARGVDAAPAFAVEAVAAQSFLRRVDLMNPDALSYLLKAWPHWYAAASFDDWIANGDRHPGNLLVGAQGELWLIDHSHSFTGDKWVAAHLKPDVVIPNQLSALMNKLLSPPEKALAMQACHAAVQRFSSVDTVQAAALARVIDQLELSDHNALTQFVATRRLSVASRISGTLGIPELALGGAK
jgi:hypothetical protein